MYTFVAASLFGAMLDQLTDRCATACLLFVLAMFYPSYALVFQLSTAVDIASHWLHLHRYAEHPFPSDVDHSS